MSGGPDRRGVAVREPSSAPPRRRAHRRAGLAALLPAVLSAYSLGLATRFMVFAILAISLDLLWGYGGVVSFGHAMFFGLGAYAVAITLTHVGGVAGTLLGLALGMAIPALLGAGAGAVPLLLEGLGVYFGIVTLALTVVFETIAIVSRDITGGLDGLYGFDIPTIWLPGSATSTSGASATRSMQHSSAWSSRSSWLDGSVVRPSA